MKLTPAAVLSVVLMLILAGCNNTPVAPIETKITPNVITLAKINTKGINPINSNDWLSPSWQEPEAWWRSLPTSQPPRSGLHAVVGWEILFDTRGNDSKFRQDQYRAGFSYDLTAHQNLRGLVTKAEITFSSAVLPSGAGVIALCQPITGAGGSLMVLAPSAQLPVAALHMSYLGSSNSAAPYPAASRIFSIPQGPFIPGAIATGVIMSPTGQGLAHFTVDVTAYVNAALERGATALSFMLTSSDEDAITGFPPSGHDCKTIYKFDELVIRHL